VRVDCLYITYWSLADPLTQSQSLPVVEALAARGYRMGLLTFEQPPWAAEPAAQARQVAELRSRGIEWIKHRYHKHPRLAATGWDVIRGTVAALSTRALLYHGRGTVAAAIAQLSARAAGGIFLNDADGPLSLEYVDAGVWKAGSLGHRLAAWAEEKALEAAAATAVLTTSRAAEVSRGGRAPAEVLPCAVDTTVFRPQPERGREERKRHGLQGTVFVYAGKFGGWYLAEPMMDFVAVFRSLFGPVSLLVLTTDPGEPFLRMAAARNLPCTLRPASRAEMPALLSAADVGLSFILPAPSKAACSPVKNGEYLACGRPIVTTLGIGDYSSLVEAQSLGVVVEGFGEPELAAAARKLKELLSDADLGARCRRAAVQQLDLREVLLPRYFSLYGRLLGAPGVRP
jgi:glycosyltransferase involved in cell wall biosynthesis